MTQRFRILRPHEKNIGPPFTAYVLAVATTLAVVYGLVTLVTRCG